ncbi:carotenoid-cleaving dioxygenase, mitochondrial-like [Penaeus chinensis]|uniref:carotenoid-cleaving dioxygenase, mitochondrial-like n=1 Tax=Penaeus chinensis TaxID=139456 RepID=UPI001FB5BE54|nr:carotenoid-cleaving dioxygenase, mitochondrial-like [Penaeus chinensis]
MSTSPASEAPAHTGNGVNVGNTYKSCKRLVQRMSETDVDDAHRVWMRSTDRATTSPVKGQLEGEIPQWLEGSLYRDGPGVLNIGDTWYHHVFDGMAVLHKFSIKGGEATYRSRILESDSYKRNSAANRIVVDEFGTRGYPDPCKTILQKFMSTFAGPDLDGMTDNCAVNVCFYGDQLFAMTETNKMRRVDPDDLKTVGDKTNVTNYVAVNMATAHPHVEPDGTVYNMGNSFMGAKGPTYNVIKFPPKKTLPSGKVLNSFEQASVVASIPCQWKMRPCYYHSFSITDNYFILVEQPLGVSVPKLLVNHYRGKSFMQAMDWIPGAKTKFRVVRRSDGHVLKADYQADTFFTFHAINAYEEDGHLVVDLCCFDDGAVVNQIWLENILKPSETFNKALQATPRRYVLPLNVEHSNSGKNLVTLASTKCTAIRDKSGAIYCRPEDLSQHCMEMPRINYKFNGKKYRYSYGFIPTKGLNCGTLCKVDAETGKTLRWELPGFQVSEPVFVERPGASEEDDGVVLASLLNEKEQKEVRMVVLDAKTFKQEALVTFKTHGVITKEFHGLFARSCDQVHRY